MSDEDKGNELVSEAEKRLKSAQGFFGGLFGGQSKIEEACDLYVRAGNAYKMAKKWSAAGNAFTRAAQIQLNQLQSKHEAASQYVEAANCYRKSDFDEAISCLEAAVEQYTDMGRFSIAAKHHMTIAEIFESNKLDADKAIVHYTKAGDYYKGEESSSSANKALLKVATLSAQKEDYETAINLYEEVATVSLESSLLKYSAREYLFKAALCHMCRNIEQAPSAIEKYCQMFPAFEDSRELKLLRALLEAKKEDDKEQFAEAVREYDAISRLDNWYTTILLRIKNSMADIN